MLHSCIFQTENLATESPEYKSLALSIPKTYTLNRYYLTDILPDLSKALEENTNDFSIFINNNNKANIVDNSTNHALYGLDAEAECEEEFLDFLKRAPYFSLTNASGIEHDLKNADVLLVFGLGLGFSLKNIIEKANVKFVILYEPRLDILKCSMYTLDWQALLELATKRGIYVGLQIGNAGTSLAEHLTEILTIQPNIEKIYYYRHLSHPVSDEVIHFYNQFSGDSVKLLRSGRQFMGFDQAEDYIPVRTQSMLGNSSVIAFENDSTLFSMNLDVFKKYFPGLAKLAENYQPSRWQLVLDKSGTPNLYHFKRHCMLYRHLYHDCDNVNRRFFSSEMNINTQVKQKVPYKLRHYLHYQAVSKLQQIEAQYSSRLSINPDLMSTVVISGCALSLSFEALLSKSNLKNIFIFEPETDFFYASLFVLPWHTLLEQLDKEGRELYLNVGGRKADYFDEILRQFYRVGAYALAETSFWLNYTTPDLNNIFSSLKQQLRSVLALGDYFDHAKYGLNQTLSNFSSDALFMINVPVSLAISDMPVFVVGNGPSLDETLAYIRSYQTKAIIVSCGTALKPLLDYGIIPDFHVEVEQNASTYDHLHKTCDNKLLKKVSLISFSSIHPATRALFEQSFLIFKESEAPTIVFKHDVDLVLNKELSVIPYAFPTAANLAISFLLNLGHKQLFLFGVDFGQVDSRYHHSKKSIYYTKAGDESYDYRKANPEQICVRGNFKNIVYTKSEFDLARKICQMQLKEYLGNVEVYNCSDGALILGAVPLLPENVLVSKVVDKAGYKQNLIKNVFVNLGKLNQSLSKFKKGVLTDDEKSLVLDWVKMLSLNTFDVLEAKIFLKQQWYHFEHVVTTSRVVFCLYYSSVAYYFSRFTNLMNVHDETISQSKKVAMLNEMLIVLRWFLKESISHFDTDALECCNAVLFEKHVEF
ncbi:motility associated factor glycosyltransferase family protein [Alishewanella tabrizica]|uniref:Motility associated factor glycosyltransferase family protein n=1 Tax=Alishewanella tabrizica TaxID=671278 RepID=A0ABQ2WMT3_9ALTE|nr:6-hydroxymethylpterin diphosphokinase MptE-like protein [Alishewanella tabrizica]GGW63457.1 hypothetical protein GCM10008111_19390 [Alishewanella tabrizica]